MSKSLKIVAVIIVLAAVAAYWFGVINFGLTGTFAKSKDGLTIEEIAEVEKACTGVMTSLRDGDTPKLWSRMHPLFKESCSQDKMSAFLRTISPSLAGIKNFPVGDVWWVKRSGDVSTHQAVSVGSLHQDVTGGVTVKVPATIDELVVAVVEIPTTPISRSCTLSMVRSGAKLQLVNVHVSNLKYNGKGAGYYNEKGKEALAELDFLTALVYLNTAVSLDSLGNFAVKNEAVMTLKLLSESKPEKRLPKRWVIDGQEYPIHLAQIIITQTDISPHISYITPSGMVPEKIKAEARKLRDYFKANYKDVAEDYPAILFEAVERLPKDGEVVPSFRVPLYMNEGEPEA